MVAQQQPQGGRLGSLVAMLLLLCNPFEVIAVAIKALKHHEAAVDHCKAVEVAKSIQYPCAQLHFPFVLICFHLISLVFICAYYIINDIDDEWPRFI